MSVGIKTPSTDAYGAYRIPDTKVEVWDPLLLVILKLRSWEWLVVNNDANEGHWNQANVTLTLFGSVWLLSINQSINQQSINHSINQSINQSINHGPFLPSYINSPWPVNVWVREYLIDWWLPCVYYWIKKLKTLAPICSACIMLEPLLYMTPGIPL